MMRCEQRGEALGLLGKKKNLNVFRRDMTYATPQHVRSCLEHLSVDKSVYGTLVLGENVLVARMPLVLDLTRASVLGWCNVSKAAEKPMLLCESAAGGELASLQNRLFTALGEATQSWQARDSETNSFFIHRLDTATPEDIIPLTGLLLGYPLLYCLLNEGTQVDGNNQVSSNCLGMVSLTLFRVTCSQHGERQGHVVMQFSFPSAFVLSDFSTTFQQRLRGTVAAGVDVTVTSEVTSLPTVVL